MVINVVVKTDSKKEFVECNDDICFVYTKSPAKENKANISVISLLSEYLEVPKSCIRIKRGLKSKMKVFEIDSL